MIALLTDFGPDNHYVAQMKARIFGEDEHANIIDITHSISPQNVIEGAFVLRDSIDAFPGGSIFVGVVDPGVGTDRGILIVESNNQKFVLPDNGLIDIVGRKKGIKRVFKIDTDAFDASSTFHGRDIMAPVAARLGKGEAADSFGSEVSIESIERIELDDPELSRQTEGYCQIEGHFVYADRFGNLISDIESNLISTERKNCQVSTGEFVIDGIHRTFGNVDEDETLALIGSHNRLEVAVNCGNARKKLGCKPIDKVFVKWKEPE